MKSLLSIVILLICLSCSRNDQYLYYVEKPTFQSFQEEHLVKELGGNSLVDILWVIDNSGSMGDDVTNVVNNADRFIEEFVKSSWLQWRMGIISTDVSEDPYLGLDKKDRFDYLDKDPVKRFQAAVRRLGSHGAPIEKIFVPIKMHLTDYPDFIRPNAHLVIIAVTDTYELSSESYMSSELMDPTEFLTYLRTIKPKNRTKGYGIFSTFDLGCPAWNWPGSNGNYAGSRLEEMMLGTSGVVYPLCSPDFGKNLSEMSKDIVNLVTYPRIMLSKRPISTSIEVRYDGNVIPGGKKEEGGLWTYDYAANSIVFYSLDFAGDENSKVEITYLEDNGY